MEEEHRIEKSHAIEEEQSIFMAKELYFRRCNFCNVFEATDRSPSGDILHYHDYTQIWYVTHGECRHYVEGQLYLMSAGDAFFIQPMISHKTILAPDSRIISCELDLDTVLPSDGSPTGHDLRSQLDRISFSVFLQDSRDRRPRFIFHPGTGRQIHQLMTELLQEFDQDLPCREDMLRVHIQELLLLFVREFLTSPVYSASDAIYVRYRSLMDDAIRYIDEHYREPLTLEDVCRISTLSRTYFCYLFKLVTQKTFVEYITEKRIQEALRLLDNASLSITDISTSLGFNDSTHFSRTFKKLMGVSPRSYRKLRTPVVFVPEDENT